MFFTLTFTKLALLINAQASSSLMQHVFYSLNDVHHDKSEVILIPIIDLQSTNLTCNCSTETPVVTFYQPLWYNAQGIICNKCLNIVCCLGRFHTLIILMGRIGYMMNRAGLEEIWRLVFTKNTVSHLISGKKKGEKKAHFAKTNRTSRLWVQLLDYADTILLFIKANN